jgi:ppGpp synthetase/RelA/SpoT-type nucleotidyltranferase
MATVVLDKSALLAQYNSSQPLYVRLQDEVQFILNEQLKDAKIPIHAIENRIKSFDSIIKKAER